MNILGLAKMGGLLLHQGLGRLLISGLVFGSALAAVVTVATGSVFTDTQSIGSNTFTTGTVDISSSPTSAVVAFTNMAPGDKVTNPIIISNAGSLQMRYAVKSTTTENTLAAQLSLTIKTDVTTCANAGFGTDGTVIYGPGASGTTSGANLIGDPTQGAQAGDRTLNASANEVLCIQVSLPLGTADSYQNLTTTASLNFIAEQTANN